jgi:hypothetical protein
MMKPVPERAREERPAEHQRRTGTAPNTPRAGGLTVSLWLLVVLIGEAELSLWLLERAYAG